MVINKINGKMYIGQTTKTLEERMKRHIYISKHDPKTHFQKALNKYGAENFIFEELEICDSMSMLNEREQYWIKKYNTLSPYGYNLNSGGRNHFVCDETKQEISNTLKEYYKTHESKSIGFKHTEETKQIISEKNKGQKRTEETKQKLREINLGKHLSEETKQKLREINLGKISPMKGKITPDNVKEKQRISALNRSKEPYKYCFKPVLDIDENIIYESIEEASKKTKINRTCIADCCNKRRKSTHKKHFRFLTEKDSEFFNMACERIRKVYNEINK